MLFKVGNEIIDTDKVPVALVFKTKEESKVVGNIISNIKNGDTEYSVENNGNWWMMFPAGTSREEIDKWSLLTPEQKELLDNKSCVSTYISNEL